MNPRTLRLPFVFGLLSGALGCASLLGLEDGYVPVDPVADGAPMPDGTLRDGATSVDAAEGSVSPPDESELKGLAIDSHGLPLVGATIRTRSAGATSDVSSTRDVMVEPSGAFTTRGAAAYDLYLRVTESGAARVFVFLGLTTRSPRIQVPYSDLSRRRSLAMNGLYQGASVVVGKPAAWSLTADGSTTWGTAVVSNAINPEYEIANGDTFAPAGTTAVLRVLSSNNALGNSPYYYGRTENFALQSVATNADVKADTGAPTQGVLSAAFGASMAVTGVEVRKQIVFAPGVGMDFGTLPFSSGMTTDVPRVPSTSFNVLVRLRNTETSTEAGFVWATGLVPGGSVLLDLPSELPEPVAPPSGELSFTEPLVFRSKLNGLREVVVSCSGTDGTSRIVTTYATTDSVLLSSPMLKTLGLDLSGGLSCGWTVKVLTAISTTDAAATPLMPRAYYDGTSSSALAIPDVKGAAILSRRVPFTSK